MANQLSSRVPFLYSLGAAAIFIVWPLRAAALDGSDRPPEPKGLPAAASPKNDSRLRSLQPSRNDFGKPFVEEVKIIHEWDGAAANDQFGWIARELGDVDADGVSDFVTSAPTSASGGESAGRVYVYSSKTGKLLWKADGQAKDQLGSGLEAAGDTNADRVPDVVASASGGGTAYVYSGNDGRVLLTLKSERKDEKFGEHVSGCGDVNHDGFADVIIGAPPPQASPNDPARLAQIGHAYVIPVRTDTCC